MSISNPRVAINTAKAHLQPTAFYGIQKRKPVRQAGINELATRTGGRLGP